MRAIIAGGGIVGLTSAIVLRAAGIRRGEQIRRLIRRILRRR